tara:strand:+ start:108 stop:488 length:381 start_codon:yes stop_codon:yes gene_type:complete
MDMDEESFKEFDVTDGKARDVKAEAVKKTRELEELLGIPQCNPYQTLSQDVFAERLENASVSELTDLAVRVGVTPAKHAKLLRKDLQKSFNIFVNQHNVSLVGEARPVIDPSSPEYDSAVKLFGDI